MAHQPLAVIPPDVLDPTLLHPMNSSRLMVSLLDLVQSGRERSQGAADLSRLVSLSVLKRLLAALQYRHPATMLHSRRTSLISVGIAQRLGWENDTLPVIEVAALLHDFGKVGMPDFILQKPGRLSPDETDFIAHHQRVALSVLQACGIRPEVIEIIAQSHGVTGQYENLSGQLNLGARILSVADAFDSLTTRQAYRQAFEPRQALRVLEEQSGKQFDRNVVAALSRWMSTPEAEGLIASEGGSAAPHLDPEAMHEAFELCYLLSSLHNLDTHYEAYFLVDPELRICMWNGGAEQVFNRPARDVLGQQWDPTQFSIVAVASSDGAYSLRGSLQDGRPKCRPLSVKDHQDQIRQLEIHTIPLCDANTVHGVLGLIYDMKQSRQHSGQFRQLHMAATRDALTGVANRGELERTLKELFEDHHESDGKNTFSVIFLDLDHFKGINDRLGHDVGDRVLIDVSRLIQDETYSGELVGRYGGEEFVVVCPETDFEAAVERAERLRRALMHAKIAGRGDLRVTASLGVSQIEAGDSIDSLIKRADEALYSAKQNGRNRTCAFRKQDQPKSAASINVPTEQKNSDWFVRVDLVTSVASDILVYKMKGFIHDHDAKLVKSSSKQLVLECGKAGLFGWGSQSSRQPVRITLDIEDAPQRHNSRQKHLMLKTTVEPVSRPLKPETFQKRAFEVIDLVRSYCIADVHTPQATGG